MSLSFGVVVSAAIGTGALLLVAFALILTEILQGSRGVGSAHYLLLSTL